MKGGGREKDPFHKMGDNQELKTSLAQKEVPSPVILVGGMVEGRTRVEFLGRLMVWKGPLWTQGVGWGRDRGKQALPEEIQSLEH